MFFGHEASCGAVDCLDRRAPAAVREKLNQFVEMFSHSTT
jgi:hypothetical protein